MEDNTLKLPAIRASMGDWIYYIGALSFEQIEKYITPDITELHDTKVLSDMLQRAITKNYIDIKNYLLTQEERLFNALVLAVYNGTPMWIDSKMTVNQEDYFDIGLLQFTGEEIIFPIDGQHRIKGILEALKENNTDNFKSEQVPVILVAHFEDEKERSRRLFSTLNRRAKAVNIRDIIVLDEDDSAAIITRRLMEKHNLFSNDRIIDIRNKAVPNTNKKAFVSTIALYDCNKEILKYFKKFEKEKDFKDYLKYRPEQKVIKNYEKFSFLFWGIVEEHFSEIQLFLDEEGDITENYFRNNTTGGSLLFRPIGLLPVIKTIFLIKKQNKSLKFNNIVQTLDEIDLQLNTIPWKYVLWNDVGKKMNRAHDKLVVLILRYKFQLLYNANTIHELTTAEKEEMSKLYQDRKNAEMTLEEVLEEII